MQLLVSSVTLICCVVNVFCALKTPTSLRQAIVASSSVDVQRQRYLSLEKALWHVIDGGLEDSYVLQQVHSGHRTFLTDNHQEKGAFLSVLDPEQRQLVDAINRINVSLSDTVGSYLRTSTRYYNERDALTVARLNQNLTYQLEQIFNISGSTDFYKVIRNVSVFYTSRNLFKYVKN